MTLKSEVAELRYEVAELSSGELRLTFTTLSLYARSCGNPNWTKLSRSRASEGLQIKWRQVVK